MTIDADVIRMVRTSICILPDSWIMEISKWVFHVVRVPQYPFDSIINLSLNLCIFPTIRHYSSCDKIHKCSKS